jgi:prophage regulatory protein
MQEQRYIRKSEITQLTGLSLSTIYRLEQDGSFPQRRLLGRNAVGWLAREVVAWLDSRPVAARGLSRD